MTAEISEEDTNLVAIVVIINVMYITVICITLNMRFYGRKKELSMLRSIKERSMTESTFTTVLGKRRAGKTSLILESVRGTKYVYLFVTRLDQKMLCERMQRAVSDAGIDIHGRIETVGDLLKALMFHSRVEPITVIIDEFQELRNVEPSIFDDIQMVWDSYRDGAHMNLIISGPAQAMAGIIDDDEQPLYDRPAYKILVEPFPLAQMRAILQEHNPDLTHEDELMTFMLTGGVPYYVAALMDSGAVTAEKMLETALSNGSVFLTDGNSLLASEFGKDCRTYASILQLISQGYEKRSEIESILGIQAGAYLERLEKVQGIIRQESPVPMRPNSRNSRWTVSDMYLRFYFRFVQPYSDYIELGRSDLHLRSVRARLAEYEGRVLEDFFRRRISEESEFTEIGGFWNRDGTIEIDIVVIDDVGKTAELIEVKRNPAKLDMGKLKEKGKAVATMLTGYEMTYRGLSMDDV